MTSMITPYDEIEPPNIDHIVTEDDEPVDNLFSEKQQRLLAAPLYTAAWCPEGDKFLAASNVGIFPSVREPPIGGDQRSWPVSFSPRRAPVSAKT